MSILARRPSEGALPEQMNMQMRNAFARIGTTVDDNAIAALLNAKFLGEFAGDE